MFIYIYIYIYTQTNPFLVYMWKWKLNSLSRVWLCGPMVYTVDGTLQARILEWVGFPFSRGSSQPRDWTQVSHIAGRFFTSWATREAQYILCRWYKIESLLRGHDWLEMESGSDSFSWVSPTQEGAPLRHLHSGRDLDQTFPVDITSD